MTSKKNRMAIYEWDGVFVLDIGEMEIWDGADLALLRETLTRLIEVENRRSIGINMRWVKYIPSGFFGMLFDWHDKGVQVHLYSPQPNVARMLWFRKFFQHASGNRHVLRGERQPSSAVQTESGWKGEVDWGLSQQSRSVAAWGLE